MAAIAGPILASCCCAAAAADATPLPAASSAMNRRYVARTLAFAACEAGAVFSRSVANCLTFWASAAVGGWPLVEKRSFAELKVSQNAWSEAVAEPPPDATPPEADAPPEPTEAD